jgi:sugar phosphate isomerase/epimerase
MIMNLKGIGINVGSPSGHLSQFDAVLKHAIESGYRVAEIGVSTLNLILNGRLIPEWLEQVQAVLRRYDLRYTVHAPNRTNLAFGYDLPMDEAVLRACIQFCRAIDAEVLVYHSGLQAIEYVRTGVYPLPSEDEMKRGAEREVEALRKIAPFAADHGVTIGMENGDPHLWEYGIMRANGKPDSDLPIYHPRLRIAPIVEQVHAVNHPNVGMTLDLGHLYLAWGMLGFDYLADVALAAPVTKHLHLSDNFGKLDAGFDNGGVRGPYGEADLHLPPGWGSIPLAEAFACFSDYSGYAIIELEPRFYEFAAQARETVERLTTAS